MFTWALAGPIEVAKPDFMNPLCLLRCPGSLFVGSPRKEEGGGVKVRRWFFTIGRSGDKTSFVLFSVVRKRREEGARDDALDHTGHLFLRLLRT